MTDSDSLRGDIDRPHPNLPQCCGELEILRALLRPRMAEVGDPTPTEALRGMFIEIERLRVTTSEGARCQALEESLTAVKHTLQALRGRLHELLQLSMDGTSDRDIFARISTMIDREGRRRPMDEAILADNESAIARLADELAAERKMARAAANGHDHARALLVAIAEVFGRVDDLDSLPAKVRELSDACRLNTIKADSMQARVDELNKQRVLRAAETGAERDRLQNQLGQMTAAIGGAAKEVGVLCEGRSALDILPDLLAHMKRRAQREVVEAVQWCTVNAGRGLAAELAQDAASKLQVALASSTDLTVRWAIAQALHIGAETAVAWADSYWAPKLAESARWTKICEAFGFDHEQDPPVSIPAILAGERWTNTRRMLADACANMRAPSLEVILGELVQTLSKARGANKRVDQALNVLGWSGADDPLEWAKEARRLADERIDVLQAELGVHAASIADAEIQTEKLAAALNEKTAALDAVPTQFSALKDTADAAHAALVHLGWGGNDDPEAWAKDMAAERSKLMAALITGHDAARKFRFDVEEALRSAGVVDYERDIVSRIGAAFKQAGASEIEAVREALGVPADKPIIPYAQHAAKGMQALAILGWQDTHPVEWATKRAAAEADLRGAFAEAELVGSDHAAMVRQLWGNLRRTSAQHLAVIEERNAQIDECAVLRSVITERNARIHQLEIDNSKVHLEGRIELAEKRLSMWRAWVVGMCPESTVPANMTDDDLRVAMTFISTEEYNRAIKALQDELARQRSLVSVMVDIKRRLVALKDLSM